MVNIIFERKEKEKGKKKMKKATWNEKHIHHSEGSSFVIQCSKVKTRGIALLDTDFILSDYMS